MELAMLRRALRPVMACSTQSQTADAGIGRRGHGQQEEMIAVPADVRKLVKGQPLGRIERARQVPHT